MQNIVLNIPYSSTQGIFDNEIGGWTPNPHFINDCVNKWTDWWTDMLFHSNNENVKSFIFPYSRFVCDAERLENDPMEEKGQGIIYTSFDGYKRKDLSNENIIKLLDIRRQYLKKISDSLTEESVLIDCHSFPQDLSDADICIGFSEDWSYNEKITNFVVDAFTKHGYKVSVNKSFSNSITPQTSFPYTSIMIEVNKKVYMNEKLLSLERNSRQWMRWYGCLNEVYDKILNNK